MKFGVEFMTKETLRKDLVGFVPLGRGIGGSTRRESLNKERKWCE